MSEDLVLKPREARLELGLRSAQFEFLVRRGVIPLKTKRGQREVTISGIELAKRALSQLKWLAVVTPENWQALVEQGLTFTAIPSFAHGLPELMRAGNQLVFYVTRYSKFVGLAKVTSGRFHRPLLLPGGVYSTRISLDPTVILDPASNAVPIRPLVPQLTFITNKQRWGLSVKKSLTLIPEEDFDLIRWHLP